MRGTTESLVTKLLRNAIVCGAPASLPAMSLLAASSQGSWSFQDKRDPKPELGTEGALIIPR